jgi:hypothetical protein
MLFQEGGDFREWEIGKLKAGRFESGKVRRLRGS